MGFTNYKWDKSWKFVWSLIEKIGETANSAQHIVGIYVEDK